MAQKTIDFENDILGPIGSLKRGLADLDDNKITKFYTNNNGDTVLNDSDDGKIQDLMIYGKSEQAQYEGINLFNYDKTTVTASGITFTYDEKSQTYNVNGTATKQVVKTLLSVTDNIYIGKKIVGCPAGGDRSKYVLMISYLDTNGAWKTEKYDIGNGYIIENYPKIYIQILIAADMVANNLVFKPMIVEDTTKTYDDFEPYVGGKPSPSPEYPQEIKAVVNPVIKTHGKNLLKATLQTNTQNGVTCINNGDGTYTLNGIATALIDMALSANFHIENGKMYRMTGWVKNVSGFIYLISGKGDVRDTGDGVTFTYNDVTNDSKVIHIRIDKDAIINNVIIKPMICTDINATYDDFKPYQETQATLPYELYAIPVSSGGNVTIDGQQYIADYVDVEKGVLVRNVVYKKITSSMGWDVVSRERSVFAINNLMEHKAGNNEILSNMLMCHGNAQEEDLGYAISFHPHIKYANYMYIQVPSDIVAIGDVSAFKKWLSDKDINILFVTNKPEKIYLTQSQIEAFKALSTYYPKTHIDAESEQLNAYTMFNYPVSMEKGWEYVKQQIGDTRKYVYDMDTKTQDIDTQSAEAYVNSEYAVALTELEV